ncbi:MAG: hypothetical protein PHX68_02155 [Alphaproteobacteria bacterium]|nr:hypothetical protein [Alphaproteobacteria bacterium]
MIKTNENGRSMVEMLGVLAIIGVLSIGGILGYTTAMNRHRANQIIDAAAKISVIAQTRTDGVAVTLDQIEATAAGLQVGNINAASGTGVVTVTWGAATAGTRTAAGSILGAKAPAGGCNTANTDNTATCVIDFSLN